MCGIVGYVGSEKGNIQAIKLITIFQRDRGKHGIGLFINNSIYKVYDTIGTTYVNDPLELISKKYFPAAAAEEYVNNVIMMHNRMSSSGQTNKDNLHPWGYDIDEKTEAYLVHNGTILNTEELADKYYPGQTFATDSQLLGQFIADGNPKVLTEYIGSAAFLFTRTDEPNTLYVWRGESKQYSSSTSNDEERPLYGLKTKKGMYIASTAGALELAFDNKDNIFEFDANTLYKISYRSGKLNIQKKVYSRDHIPAPPKKTVEIFPARGHNDYDYGYSSNYNKHTNASVKPPRSTFTLTTPHKRDKFAIESNRLTFYNGRYYLDNKLADSNFEPLFVDYSGIVHQNLDGILEDEVTKLWATQGILFDSYENYLEFQTLIDWNPLTNEENKLKFRNSEFTDAVRGLIFSKSSLFIDINTQTYNNLFVFHKGELCSVFSYGATSKDSKHYRTFQRDAVLFDDILFSPWEYTFEFNFTKIYTVKETSLIEGLTNISFKLPVPNGQQQFNFLDDDGYPDFSENFSNLTVIHNKKKNYFRRDKKHIRLPQYGKYVFETTKRILNEFHNENKSPYWLEEYLTDLTIATKDIQDHRYIKRSIHLLKKALDEKAKG